MHEINIGDINLTWLGHASFVLSFEGRKIFIDPFVIRKDMEKADIILVTHDHFDHCDVKNINRLMKDGTKIFASASSMKKIGFGNAMSVGKTINVEDIKINAVEAYNTNKSFHPKGFGVGFVIDINDKRIYHAGDTDNIPEMSKLKNIDIALMPAGGTYTMNVKEIADAANRFNPSELIPMHYNSDKYGVSGINADPNEIKNLSASIALKILTPLV